MAFFVNPLAQKMSEVLLKNPFRKVNMAVSGATTPSPLEIAKPFLCGIASDEAHPFSSRRVLEDFAGLGLIEFAGQDAVRQHDLLRVLAAEHLGADVASVHRRLLASYNSAGQPWPEITDDGYLWDNLIHHLNGALGWRGPNDLLCEETDDQSRGVRSNAWFVARQRADALDCYRADLDQALTIIGVANEAAAVRAKPTPLIACDFQYALFRASATSATASPPAAIIRAVVDERVVPLPQILHRLHSIVDVGARTRALITVAKAVEIGTAVEIFRHVQRGLEDAAETIGSAEHKELALELARALLDRGYERDALNVIRNLPSVLRKPEIRDIFARLTSRACLDDAWAWIKSLGDKEPYDLFRSHLIAALGSHDPKLADVGARVLMETQINHIMERDIRAGQLGEIVSMLPAESRSYAVTEVLETALSAEAADMDVGRLLAPVARFLSEDDVKRAFDRVNAIDSTQFRVEALFTLLQSGGRQRAVDDLRTLMQDISQRERWEEFGVFPDDYWEGVIKLARALPELRTNALDEFLCALSELDGDHWNGSRWLRKVADILPDDLADEALDVIDSFPPEERAEGCAVLLDLVARVPRCLDRLIGYAKALKAPKEYCKILIGLAERCLDRREALLADVVTAIPNIEGAISRFELACRVYRLRASGGPDPAELLVLTASLQREGAAAGYFGLEDQPPGLPYSLIQDAFDHALAESQPSYRFRQLEALATHLDSAQLRRAWHEFSRIGGVSRVNDAKAHLDAKACVLEIVSVARHCGIDGDAWLVAGVEAPVPGLLTFEIPPGTRLLLRFLANLIVRASSRERMSAATWMLMPQVVRIGDIQTATMLARQLAERPSVWGSFDAEDAARLIVRDLDREALAESASRVAELYDPLAAVREFAAIAASLPRSVRVSTECRLHERLDEYPPRLRSPGKAALLVAAEVDHTSSSDLRDRLFEVALGEDPIDCETLLALEPILDEMQLRRVFQLVIETQHVRRFQYLNYNYGNDLLMRTALRLPDKWAEACTVTDSALDKHERVEFYTRLLRSPRSAHRTQELLDLATNAAYSISAFQPEFRAVALLRVSAHVTDQRQIVHLIRDAFASSLADRQHVALGDYACIATLLCRLTRSDAYMIWRDLLLAHARNGRPEFLHAAPILGVVAAVLGGHESVSKFAAALDNAQRWWP